MLLTGSLEDCTLVNLKVRTNKLLTNYCRKPPKLPLLFVDLMENRLRQKMQGSDFLAVSK